MALYQIPHSCRSMGHAILLAGCEPTYNALTQRPQTGLFKLPAELRNRIYSLVLIENDTIDVDPLLSLPAILGVCRQLRLETLQLYYSSNDFRILARNCDGTLMHKWVEHWSKMPGKKCVSFNVCGALDWTNLEVWLFWRWEHKFVFVHHNLDLHSGGCNKAILAAHNLLGHFLDQPWSEFKEAIENLRLVVLAYDSSWV